MDKFHNQKLPYLIYAILWEDDGDEFVFVGKTTTADTKALLRRHMRGEVSITKMALKRDDLEAGPPRLIVLQSLVCTGAEAYKYILCYHRLYEDFGFMTVAYRGTDNQAYDMLPYTKHLYEELQKTVTREFLFTGITIAKPATNEPVSRQKRELTTQLNVRLDMHMLRVFQRFCSKLGITQREGFIHLMYCADQDGLSVDPLFVEQRKTIERHKRRIEELEAKLCAESRGQKADAKLKAAITNIKQLIAQYLELVAEIPSGPLLKDESQYVWRELITYMYPDSDGEALLEIHRRYCGRGKYPAEFLCGRNLFNGTAIKLRYYPRETYVGCSPNSKYAVEKAHWLVSYKRVGDVTELVAALPLPYCAGNERAKLCEQNCSSSDIKTLDELIQEANEHVQ